MNTQRSRLLLVAAFLLLLFVPAALAQETIPPIQISAQPGEPAGDITIAFPAGSDQTSATIPVYIGQTGTETIPDVLFYGELTDCQGQPLTQGSVQFLKADGDEALGAIPLPPGDGQQRVQLRVSDLGDQFGDFCGLLGAEISGQHFRYNGLVVQRPAAPQVIIREADEDKGIRLLTHGPTLDEALFVSETSRKAGVPELRVIISPLRAAGNQTAQLEEPPVLSLEPGSSATIPIKGTIPAVAEYRGVLTLQWDEEPVQYDLIVERQPMSQTVTLEAVAPVEDMVLPIVSRWASVLPAWVSQWLAPRLLSGVVALTSLDMPITVTETAGTFTEVYYPSLVQLNRLDADDNATSARYAGTLLYDCEGKPIQRTTATGEPALLSLEPYQSVCLRMAITGLARWGKYQAGLELRSPSGGSATTNVTIRLRDMWLLVAAVIFLGALGSYVLRWWLVIGRATRLKEITVARQEELVRENIADPNDAVRKALLRKLHNLRQELQVNSSLDVDATLKTVMDQLNTYLEVLKITGMDLSEAVPPQHRNEAARLVAAIDDLLDDVDPLANLDKAKEQAKALKDQIERWNREALEKGIDALSAAVKEDGERLKTLGLDEQPVARFQAELDEVSKQIPQKAEIDRDYEGTRARYEVAAKSYADLAPRRLRLILSAQKRPTGFSDAEWTQLRDDCLARLARAEAKGLEPAQLQQEVDDLREEYLGAVIEKLHTDAESKRSSYENAGDTDRAEAMGKVMETLAAAQGELASGKLDQCEARYVDGRKQYLEALPPDDRNTIMGADDVAKAGAPAVPLGAPADLEQPGRPPAKAEPVAGPETVAAIVEDIKRWDRRALLITSAVSVVIGISYLWVPNSTFGSLSDYIAAFLWGFGLHQLNAVAMPEAARNLELPWYPVTNAGDQGQQP